MANQDVTLYDVLRAVQEVSAKVDGTNNRLDKFEKETNERFRKIDERFDKVEERLDSHDKRFDQIDERLANHDKRFDKLEEKMDKSLNNTEALAKRVWNVEKDLYRVKNTMEME